MLSADVRNLTETNAAAAISSSGTLTISDPDSPTTTFVAQAGTLGSYGTFAITNAGAWTYAASSAHNEFAGGNTATTVTGAGAFNPGPTWHVKGTGSAPIRDRTGRSRAPAISTATASPTSCGKARMEPPRCG